MMDIEAVRLYCLSFPMTTEGFPFDETTLVFKVAGKMFALIGLDSPDPTINLKCDPFAALEWRERYPEDVLPGWHMNKRHWNTVRLEGNLTSRQLQDMIGHSYDLVVKGLPKKLQANIRRPDS
ncbi:MAG: hypothetical protein RLY31_3154 [Bacteroidota bacterium]|jgi:predicted DNA-binding protein (MmcQ/YjbR family)